MKKTTSASKVSRIILMFLLTVLMITSFCGCSATPQENPSDIINFKGTEEDIHYYTTEQAREILTSEGYNLGEDIETVSEDGYFYYVVSLIPEDFNLLTISGCLEFTAQYEDERWFTYCNPLVNYDWNITGNWFAETEHYDVYMDVLSYNDSKLSVILEAQYDSTEGGKGSYGKQKQEVSLRFYEDSEYESDISDVYLYCEVSGGYPIFQLHIDKNTMTICQLYDNFKAELVAD